MTLQEVVNTLKNIALTQPMIQAVSDGDVYEKMNGNPSVKYAVFHCTQTTHTSEDGWDNYGLSLFVIDRLMDDNTNRLEIQSQAKEALINIMRTFCENFDAECSTLTFTPFTQKFTDNTAGVWCNVTVAVMQDYACPYNYEEGQYFPSVVIIDNKDITITQNGVYEVPEGYTGYGQITVALEMQPSKYFEAMENGRYTITPDDGYASMESVDIDVNIPIQEEREIWIDTNGTYKLNTQKGYAGTKLWNVNVEVYQPNILDNDTISLKAGDKGTYTTPDGYNAVRTLDYEVAPINILQSDNVTVKAGESKTYTAEGYDGVKELNIEASAPNILASDKVEVKAGETITYEVDDEYDGIKELEISASAPNILQSDRITIKAGQTFTYEVDDEYDGIKQLEVEGTPNQDITDEITENGTYTYVPEAEYSGIGNATINVNIPLQDEKSQTIKQSGTYIITPDDDYKAVKKVNIEVDIKAAASDKPVLPNGICLSGSTYSGVFDMEPWDWSKVYDWGNMFYMCSGITELANFPQDVKIRSCENMFASANNIATIPSLNTTYAISMYGMFSGNSKITTVPPMDTSNVRDMGRMFSSCLSLTTVPPMDTSNVTNMDSMFNSCDDLTTVPPLDTSKVKNMYRIFYGCSSLQEIPPLDTSNVTTMQNAFSFCYKLTTLPPLDTSKVTNMNAMCQYCSGLTTVESVDVSSVTDMSYTFADCPSLKSIRFTGNPSKLTSVSGLYNSVKNGGTVYYPAAYASAYNQIIGPLRSKNWTVVEE